MKFKFIELHEKLEKIDSMISEVELEFLQKEYGRLLAIEERKVKQNHKEVQRLHGMVCFLSAWGITKLDKRSF
jgi:hypothetical protein